MDSDTWARYIEATDGLAKPWLLLQWRLQKLQERRHELSPDAYGAAVAELHQELMALGDWWSGREAEVFGFGDEQS